MYTPQEVQDKKFPKAVFGGYDMGEVDDFLDGLSADYAALYKENAVLKSKLKVLAEKVEEYRSVDAAMRKALIVAQKMANEMTEEAKVKSDEIRAKARLDYENNISALKDSIKNEERRLQEIKDQTRQYVEASIVIYQRQIDTLKKMISSPAEKKSDFEEKAEEIDQSIYRAIRAEMESAPRVTPPAEVSNTGSPKQASTSPEDAEPSDNAAIDFGSFPEVDFSDLDLSDPSPIESDVAVVNEALPIANTDVDPAETDPIETDPIETEEIDFSGGFSNATQGNAKQEPFELFRADNPETNAAASDPSETPAPSKKQMRSPGGPREVNVGGMNIRVFEMELGGDKSKK